MKKITLTAPDISCEHCAMRIKKALANLASNVLVDVPTKQITFEYSSEQELEQAKQVLSEIGYPVNG